MDVLAPRKRSALWNLSPWFIPEIIRYKPHSRRLKRFMPQGVYGLGFDVRSLGLMLLDYFPS